MIAELKDKNINIKQIVPKVINNTSLIKELIDNLNSKDDILRYNSFQVLQELSLIQPVLLYPYWDKFQRRLTDKNSFHKLHAIIILANLSFIDIEDKFMTIFDSYCSLLNDKSFIVAVNVMEHLGSIAKAKPALRDKITHILLDSINNPQKHKGLMTGAALTSLDEYVDYIDNKTEIISFAQKLLDSESPKTRKIAQNFLIRYHA